ncbi:hypothetical protein FOPE_12260 [Fonsecaea pedrosoi]|nr:hypothetical protein FOPE_12260 [Fonsecaea pedrosoi]
MVPLKRPAKVNLEDNRGKKKRYEKIPETGEKTSSPPPNSKRSRENSVLTNEGLRISFAADDIMTVIVGPNKVAHLVHESVLCKSIFFNKCLHAGMREEEEKSITLPEDDPEDFALIVQWLYSGRLPNDLKWRDMIRGYTAAVKFLMYDLQNAVVDWFRVELPPLTLDADVVMHIWDSTPEGCELRRLLLDTLFHEILKTPAKFKLPPDADGDDDGQGNIVRDRPVRVRTKQDGTSVAVIDRVMNNPQLRLEMFWRFADPDDRPPREYFKIGGCVYHVHEDRQKCDRDDAEDTTGSDQL